MHRADLKVFRPTQFFGYRLWEFPSGLILLTYLYQAVFGHHRNRLADIKVALDVQEDWPVAVRAGQVP